MKKLIYTVPLIVFILSSCSENYLDVTPKTEFNALLYYKTKDQAIAALTSAYDPMHWPELYGRDYIMTNEGMSDDGYCEITTWEQLVIKPGDAYVKEMYDVLYKGVVRSNIVLEKVPGIEMDKALNSRILAEAKFLRAYYYFHLVSIYGEVPLITKVLNPDELKLPKTKTQEIWKQIEADLTDAIQFCLKAMMQII
jgi:starch-binding outer membrane protein, SusD/RagB family